MDLNLSDDALLNVSFVPGRTNDQSDNSEKFYFCSAIKTFKASNNALEILSLKSIICAAKQCDQMVRLCTYQKFESKLL